MADDAVPTSTVPTTAVVYVTYRTPALDLAWVPPGAPVVVVHNDTSLDAASCVHAPIVHIANRNTGFGAGMNLGIGQITTQRVVIANPDTELTAEHWNALARGRSDEVVTIPLDDADGVPTAIVSPYPTPLSHLAAGYRLGRFVRRGSRLRAVLSRLDPWTRTHETSFAQRSGRWSLGERWAGGALLSVDVERFRAVGGFDPAYFLYFEDTDLCDRLARRFPDMTVTVAAVAPGVHTVGASSGADNRTTALHHVRSAQRWAAGRAGWRWRLVGAALTPRRWWLELRA